MLDLGADSMADGADHVALLDFGEEAMPGASERSRARQAEGLRLGIAVVKVHLERLEDLAAIRARNATKFTEQFEIGVLSRPHSGNFRYSVPLVVGDVRLPLIPDSNHGSV
jgi:hypothetical protein